MKRVVLAKLSEVEFDKLQQLEANVNTYRTLLNNQFLEKEDRETVMQKGKELRVEYDIYYKNICNKYHIPYNIGNTYQFSPETHELYVELK